MDKNLKKILIKTKRSIFSNKIGNNTSKFKGEGYDFTELREYEDGEDVRKIDWVISAKIGKPYVKVFHAQRELDINIVALLDGGVSFGTNIPKQEIITEISSIIGYSCILQGDNYTSFVANDTLEMVTKKTKNINSIESMAQRLYHYEPVGKKVFYEQLGDKLYKAIRKKSIIFLIGDFLDADELSLKLLSKKHEVIAIIVRDHFEENPAALGNVHLVDPSTLEHFDGVMSESISKAYSQEVKQRDKRLFKNFKQWGVESIKIYTNDNIFAKMMKVFT